MEASALTHASRRGLLGRRSPLVRLQGDERLVALIRAGNDNAFEVLFDRYHSRLLAFCRHMLRSQEDAEDVLQEVFVKAHGAMLADERRINVRPWLYRIARNRCLNHLRKPVAEGQDTMDVLPSENGATTAERVQRREDFRALVAEVGELPETQRTALLLREIDALSYEEIAQAMDTTIPAVKSLLVRARISLAEATHSRQLTCGEVQLELAEAAEGLRNASGPVRHHVKRCEPCRDFRGELRSNKKALAALAPLGPLAVLQNLIASKLGIGGSSSAAGGGAAAASGGAASGGAAAGAGAGGIAAGAGAGAGGAGAAGAAGGAAVGGAAAAAGGSGAAITGATAAGGLGSALGAKAAATAATAALITAGAVEVKQIYSDRPASPDTPAKTAFSNPPVAGTGAITESHAPAPAPAPAEQPPPAEAPPVEEPVVAPPVETVPAEPAPPAPTTEEDAVSTPPETGEGSLHETNSGEPIQATATPIEQSGTSPAPQPSDPIKPTEPAPAPPPSSTGTDASGPGAGNPYGAG